MAPGTVEDTVGALREDAIQPGSVPARFDRRLLLVMVLAILVAGFVLAAATGHHAVAPHAATPIEYGL